MLDELMMAVRQVDERATGAVVRVRTGGRTANAVVVGKDRLVTNAHNVVHGQVMLQFDGGGVAEATVAGSDVDGDLAVLAADTGSRQVIQLAEDAAQVGQPVFAVVAAARGPRITFGTVAAVGAAFRGPRGRRITGSIEHTAAMAAGSSGSALVDTEGRLLGLNTNRVEGGLYQALPANASLIARIEDLAEGKEVRRPRLGVALAPPWAARRMRAAVGLSPGKGVLVREVDPSGSAAAAGIGVGDMIVAIDGRPVRDADDLSEAIDTAEGALRLDLLRGEEERSVTVALGD